MRAQFADYLGEVNRLDRSLKALLDAVAAAGCTGNTLTVFCGDNGLALPHGKGSLYDPGCNVPLVVHWPGVVKAGAQSRALLSGEDLGPTLLAAAGVAALERMTGISFLPLLRGEPYTPRRHVFLERGPHGSAPVALGMTSAGYDLSRAVRSDRYKFIYNCTPWIPYAPVDSAGGAGWTQIKEVRDAGALAPALGAAYFTAPRPVYELYDLEADPSELANLSGRPDLAEIERNLRSALIEKMVFDGDHLPLPVPGPAAAGARKEQR